VRVLIIVHSYHHGNTAKVARAIAEVLGASIRTPAQASPEDLMGCDLVGFGSGIDSAKHYRPLLDFVDRLPQASNEKAFIFSTCGIPAALAGGEMLARQVAANHASLRHKLRDKGYGVIDEFGCVGFNTNSFLKLFGGLNRGRPNADDFQKAAGFAEGMLRRCGGEAPSEAAELFRPNSSISLLRRSTMSTNERDDSVII
jgi:flavodoxin